MKTKFYTPVLVIIIITGFLVTSCNTSRRASVNQKSYLYQGSVIMEKDHMVGLFTPEGEEIIPSHYRWILPLNDKYFDACSNVGNDIYHSIYDINGRYITLVIGSVYGMKDDVMIYEPFYLNAPQAVHLLREIVVVPSSRDKELQFVWKQPFIIQHDRKMKLYDLYTLEGEPINFTPIFKIIWEEGRGKIKGFQCTDGSTWEINQDDEAVKIK